MRNNGRTLSREELYELILVLQVVSDMEMMKQLQ